MGTKGHGRLLAEALEEADDVGVLAVDDVLVVALAPSGDGRFVTSERGTVTGVGSDRMTVRFASGLVEVLSGDQLDRDHLDHAYASTVHRVQGATVDTAHVFADGGGRELAYVAMSRARSRTHVYMTADGHEQASEDLGAEWRSTVASAGPSMSTAQPSRANRRGQT